MRRIAQEVGYRALCFGQVDLAVDDGDSFALYRVPVKRTMQEAQFNALLRFDNATLHRLRFQQWLRDVARKTLGPCGYLRLSRLVTQRGIRR
jgi:hypothetical protein